MREKVFSGRSLKCLNLHYGARFYDPAVVVDELYQFYTPCAYGPNNPVNGVDPDGNYWTPVHRQFTRMSMEKFGYSKYAMEIAAYANSDTDKDQLPNALHAMADFGQSRLEAMALARDVINNEISLAVTSLEKGDYEGALKHLGRSHHTAQDANRHFYGTWLDHFNPLTFLIGFFMDGIGYFTERQEAVGTTDELNQRFHDLARERMGDNAGKALSDLKNYNGPEED